MQGSEDRSLQYTAKNEAQVLLEFELHYGLSSRNAGDVISEILHEMTIHKHVHPWDEKLVAHPLRPLAAVLRRYLTVQPLDLKTLLQHSVVDEIFTTDGCNRRRPAMQEQDNAESYLFFSKV